MKYRFINDHRHEHPVRPMCSWVTDITYIRTWQGWLYLAVVMDLFARKVVGWSMKPTLARELVLDAVLMAVWRRKPKQQVLIHSDQGTQYGSDDWQRFCRDHNLDPSMSRRGNWPAAMSSTTLRCFTIDGVAIAILVVSAPRPSSRPHFEAWRCS